MNARSKLNQHYTNGAIVMAGVIAAICQSWLLFVILSALFLGTSIRAGEIRLQPEWKRQRRPRRSRQTR